jgi:hypothetical protein
MYKTTSQLAYTVGKKLPKKKDYTMITSESMKRYMNNGRILAKEYGSVLPYHGEDRDLRMLTTSNHSEFGGKYADSHHKKTAHNDSTLEQHEHGFGSRVDKGRNMKTYGATGERLKKGLDEDPKNHTFVQRSWLYDRSSYSQYKPATQKTAKEPVENVSLVLGPKSKKKTGFHRVKMSTASADGIWSG